MKGAEPWRELCTFTTYLHPPRLIKTPCLWSVYAFVLGQIETCEKHTSDVIIYPQAHAPSCECASTQSHTHTQVGTVYTPDCYLKGSFLSDSPFQARKKVLTTFKKKTNIFTFTLYISVTNHHLLLSMHGGFRSIHMKMQSFIVSNPWRVTARLPLRLQGICVFLLMVPFTASVHLSHCTRSALFGSNRQLLSVKNLQKCTVHYMQQDSQSAT